MPVIGERPEITLDRIFVATDFSPSAEKAVAYAAALARRYSATFELLNVVDLSVINASACTLVGPDIEILKEVNAKLLKEAADRITGLKVEARLLEGFSPSKAILDATSAAPLLVMGTTSKHGLEKLALGSIAEQVLRSAACPVLTIGPKAPSLTSKSLSFHQIVFATDFSAQAAKAAPLALAFAEDSTANLYLCHAVPEKRSLSDSASSESFLSALEYSVSKSAFDWCNPRFVVEHGQVDKAILELADSVHADLIVLGARKASFWLSYVHTGLTPALLAEAKCPVLTAC